MTRQNRRNAFHMARNDQQNALAMAAREGETNRLRASAFDYLSRNGLQPGSANALAGFLDFVPVVGDLSGAEDTYQSFRAGDYGGAAVNAGATALGVVPGLGDAAGAALGIFAGALARNADHVKLGRAQELAASGADPRAVWDETGWFQGADGKWRFEIDDSQARATGVFPRSGAPLGERFAHDALYEAYPDMRGINASMKSMEPKAAYKLEDDAITVQSSGPVSDSSVIHELQHATQSREGMARGGELFSDGGLDEYNALANERGTLFGNAYRVESDALTEEMAQSGLRPGSREYAAAWQATALANPRKYPRIARITEIDAKADLLKSQAFQKYRNLSGEVEARNVQTRRNMTPDQRRASPPWETEDTPRDRQIVRFR